MNSSLHTIIVKGLEFCKNHVKNLVSAREFLCFLRHPNIWIHTISKSRKHNNFCWFSTHPTSKQLGQCVIFTVCNTVLIIRKPRIPVCTEAQCNKEFTIEKKDVCCQYCSLRSRLCTLLLRFEVELLPIATSKVPLSLTSRLLLLWNERWQYQEMFPRQTCLASEMPRPTHWSEEFLDRLLQQHSLQHAWCWTLNAPTLSPVFPDFPDMLWHSRPAQVRKSLQKT